MNYKVFTYCLLAGALTLGLGVLSEASTPTNTCSPTKQVCKVDADKKAPCVCPTCGRPMPPKMQCQGPEREIFPPRNPDGSVREDLRPKKDVAPDKAHPWQGKLPFDTLSQLTGEEQGKLYAEAYKGKKTAAALAKEKGILAKYKEARLAVHKEIWEKRHAEHQSFEKRLAKRLEMLAKRIDAGQTEMPPRKHRPGPKGPRGYRPGNFPPPPPPSNAEQQAATTNVAK